MDWLLETADDAADVVSTRVTLTHSGLVPESSLDRETAPGWEYLLESLRRSCESA